MYPRYALDSTTTVTIECNYARSFVDFAKLQPSSSFNNKNEIS